MAYARRSDASRFAAVTAFWLLFYLFGVGLALMTFRVVGAAAPAAMIVQVGCLLWVAAVLLHVRRHRWQYAVATAGILLLWLPMLYREAWIVWGIVRLVRQGQVFDGNSPMGLPALVIGEMLVFVPLTALLVILLRFKLWRVSPTGAA